MKFRCAYCKKWRDKPTGEVNRARLIGAPLYCDRKHAGLARRSNKTKTQKRAEKAAYDAVYREKNIEVITAKKAIHFQKTYDPVEAAKYRKKRMHLHIKYCQQPEYRLWKKGYDKQYKATKDYGPFAEVAILTTDLNRAIKERMTNHEIKWQNKTSNKTQFRDRESKGPKRADARPRHRERRNGHTTTVS